MKLSLCLGLAAVVMSSSAQATPLATVERNGSYVAVEPFAPNVVHVTIALERGPQPLCQLFDARRRTMASWRTAIPPAGRGRRAPTATASAPAR